MPYVKNNNKKTFVLFAFLVVLSQSVKALIITPELEVVQVVGVDSTFTTVPLQNTYTNKVVVCTYVLPSSADNEAVVRLNNALGAGSSFDMRIQRPQDSAAVTPSDVYCIVSEQGESALPDGRIYEAKTVLSDGTNGKDRGWGVGGVNGAENITGTFAAYPAESEPTLIGQVMTHNDTDFSAFWSFDCENRGRPPFTGDGADTRIQDGACVGKHVGKVVGAAGDRANETLGYMIVDQGANPVGSFNAITYRNDVGGDTIRGVGNSPPYTYGALGAQFNYGAASQVAEDGGDGSWAVLYGNDPLAASSIDLALDEETIQPSTNRRHTTEQVAYWLFSGIDRGDAPLSYGVAEHIVSGDLYLGSVANGDPDAELAPLAPGLLANADDATGPGQVDDEDGVVEFRAPQVSPDTIEADVQLYNPNGESVTVCAWLDIPAGGSVDGSFDPSDGSCTTTSAVNPLLTFSWLGLPTDVPYDTFARVRVTSASEMMTVANPSGLFNKGEVEDYPVSFDFRPTYVSIGEIEVEAISLDALVDQLGLNELGVDDLTEFARSWVPNFMLTQTAPSRDQVLHEIFNSLDPDGNGQVPQLKWSTLEERGAIGFFAQRLAASGEWMAINQSMLPGMINAPMGAEYRLMDPQAGAQEGEVQYRLIEVEASGTRREYGPFKLTLD